MKRITGKDQVWNILESEVIQRLQGRYKPKITKGMAKEWLLAKKNPQSFLQARNELLLSDNPF